MVAVGAVLDGWTLHPDERVDWRTGHRAGSTLPADARRIRCRTVQLVGRGGAGALAMHTDGTDPVVHTTDDGSTAGSAVGSTPDGLRRMFGLPTPPCDVSPLELWTAVWLDSTAASFPPPATWGDVVRLHPATSILVAGGVPADVVCNRLDVIGRMQAERHDWSRIRSEAVSTGAPVFGVPPEVAAWADEGMFARLVVRAVGPVWAGRQAAGLALGPDLVAKIDDVLDRLHLDATPPS